MKTVNFCGNRYRTISGNWKTMYLNVINAFNELGYDINLSKYLSLEDAPPFITPDIVKDNDSAVYVYNHTPKNKLIRDNFTLGRKTLILKPTGPTPNYFTIDTEGYAASSSITYNKPAFEAVSSSSFFSEEVTSFKLNRENKWSDRDDLQFIDTSAIIPEDHILVIGQMPADETVTDISFGDHWRKLEAVVETLIHQKRPVVVKVHPTLKRESNIPDDKGITGWFYYYQTIEYWKSKNITVLFDFESLHDILPKTYVAILENSTSGIDCALYDVPMITYGLPEYHWITFDLRHLQQLLPAVEDLSWFDLNLSRAWLTWFCTEYQCYNYTSTLNRLKTLL